MEWKSESGGMTLAMMPGTLSGVLGFPIEIESTLQPGRHPFGESRIIRDEVEKFPGGPARSTRAVLPIVDGLSTLQPDTRGKLLLRIAEVQS